jgi:hypothetical protein
VEVETNNGLVREFLKSRKARAAGVRKELLAAIL